MQFALKLILLIFVYFSTTVANPFVGLFDPACFVVSNNSCPNENVTFWLYTNETRNTPFQLDPLDLNPWQFQPRRPVKILIHGYTGHHDFAPNSQIRPALLDNEAVYVISVDYGPLVRYPCYFAAVENLPIASRCMAQLINNLVDRNIVLSEDLHIIGFSLGGQVAGQIANYVNKPLKRVTGLDPAKPMFVTASRNRKLDATDAEFVDVIHTDVLGRGMLQAMGHVDFYPNIGPFQPGCQQENVDDPGSCNHDRAPHFYAESVNSKMGFWSHSCASWLHYTFNLCYPTEKQELMGYNVDKNARGSFFLTTNHKSPFALGRAPISERSSEQNRALSYYNIKNVDDMGFEPQLHLAFVTDDAAIEDRRK